MSDFDSALEPELVDNLTDLIPKTSKKAAVQASN